MSKIFLNGPSGSGKTTIGNILENEYGWTHIDCEKMHKSKGNLWLENPMSFIPESNNLILTWGLINKTFPVAKKIINNGFIYIYLQGKEQYINKSLRDRGENETFIFHKERKENRNLVSKKIPDDFIEAFDKFGFRVDVAQIINKKYKT